MARTSFLSLFFLLMLGSSTNELIAQYSIKQLPLSIGTNKKTTKIHSTKNYSFVTVGGPDFVEKIVLVDNQLTKHEFQFDTKNKKHEVNEIVEVNGQIYVVYYVKHKKNNSAYLYMLNLDSKMQQKGDPALISVFKNTSHVLINKAKISISPSQKYLSFVVMGMNYVGIRDLGAKSYVKNEIYVYKIDENNMVRSYSDSSITEITPSYNGWKNLLHIDDSGNYYYLDEVNPPKDSSSSEIYKMPLNGVTPEKITIKFDCDKLIGITLVKGEADQIVYTGFCKGSTKDPRKLIGMTGILNVDGTFTIATKYDVTKQMLYHPVRSEIEDSKDVVNVSPMELLFAHAIRKGKDFTIIYEVHVNPTKTPNSMHDFNSGFEKDVLITYFKDGEIVKCDKIIRKTRDSKPYGNSQYTYDRFTTILDLGNLNFLIFFESDESVKNNVKLDVVKVEGTEFTRIKNAISLKGINGFLYPNSCRKIPGTNTALVLLKMPAAISFAVITH